MSIDVTLSRSATEYLDAVCSGLLDLDEDDREAFLRELEEHLSELGEQDPREILGDPDSFVAEFRNSAGLEAHRRPGPFSRMAAVGRRCVQALAEHPVSAPFHRHRSELRTVWVWTRGWILLYAIWWLNAYWAGSAITFGIPWSDSQSIVPLLLIVAATAGSVWLAGHRGDRQWARIDRLATTATVAVVVLAWLNPVWIDPPIDDSQVYISEPPFSNIYAYDRSGEPVEVLLYDQDGQPLYVTPGFENMDYDIENIDDETSYDQWGPLRYETDRYGRPIANLYPLERLTEDWNPQTETPVFTPIPPPRVAIPEFSEGTSDPGDTSSPDPDPGVTNLDGRSVPTTTTPGTGG